MAFRAEPNSMLDLHCNLYDWTQVAVVGKPKGANENSSTNDVNSFDPRPLGYSAIYIWRDPGRHFTNVARGTDV